MVVIGIDTGGTFTDFIFRHGEQWELYKCLSTPSNPAEAILDGLRHIAAQGEKTIVHGSTVATNAILERKGVKTALVTNRGFEDVIEIGRQNRTRLYDLKYRREPHIVPKSLRFGVAGRVGCNGEIHESFDESGARETARRILEENAESVAVCFLFSFANPDHERTMKRILEDSGISVSASHEILSEFREYERTSTTVINAYVSPVMKKYISHLANSMEPKDRLRIMQSNGGAISAETAMTEPVRTILSGPAGGVVGAFEIGRIAGRRRLITFDMGGTSTDVSLIDGGLSLTTESKISEYPVKVPMADIHTVGAGGGSIARPDAGGSLKVGPDSAGADPGPICYGTGRDITVTDANLYLGRLAPERFLGGNMRLHPERLGPFFEAMAKPLGLTPIELAQGVLDVANTNMEKAIRVISVERGYDPAEFTLFSFGGAGPMHAAFLARLLHIPEVLAPQHPGILSAMGMLMADVVKDYSQTVMIQEKELDQDDLIQQFRALEKRAYLDLLEEGVQQEQALMERYLDMRYQGQSYEILAPFGEDCIGRFHELHESTYGYRNPNKSVEIVNVRLRARGVPDKPEFRPSTLAGETPPPEAFLGERNVVFDLENVKAKILSRERLMPGNLVPGPAIVAEYSSTVVIPPFAQGRVDPYGNFLLEID
ncbi:MAG: hydantoinase/oxoprolinase family protein [Deltaproteobacteria bacterium]|nr:hydantoinase/oxoprolinase family protein [Deltaproteobacteria bacterium]